MRWVSRCSSQGQEVCDDHRSYRDHKLQRIHRMASELDPSRAPMETLMVSITDHDTVDVAALAETRAQADLVMATLGASRDSAIIRLQFGLDGRAPIAQREIAATLGVSATTVAKAQTRIMARLQERFAA